MAATKSSAKKTAKTTVAKKTVTEEAAATEMESTASDIKDKPTKTIRAKKNADLDPSMYVEVKNGFNGVLVYISKKTGEEFKWDEFGDTQEMELSELRNAKNHSKAFFINNWFLIDNEEVIDWLGVSQYYENALNSRTFDELFEKTPEEIKKIVSKLSEGQKSSLAYRSKKFIDDGTIDSMKTISALEESLGVELIEK